MGRPPIGKTAMTGAERVRRYRAKHGTKPVTKRHASVTKPEVDKATRAAKAEIAALAKELAQAKTRITEVERERHTALAAEASIRKMLDDGYVVIAEAKAILAAKAPIPFDVYKTVLHSAHPDRTTDPKMKARYQKALLFLKDHQRMLAKKPPRKWQVQEERKAKRAAKANPPKALGRR
jgi:hypothetical protein